MIFYQTLPSLDWSFKVNILTFSSKQLHAPRILNLNDELRDIARIYRHDLPVRIKLLLNPAEDLIRIYSDRLQLGQLLNALLKNAEEALLRQEPGNEQPRIEISTLPPMQRLPDGVAEDEQLNASLYSGFSVKDNGPGIPLHIQSQVFDPFFTTKGVGEGPGLGLATAYGIIRQNSAFVHLRSAPGEGCTVSVYWPMYDESKL